ncbi:hypothetical protein A5819_000279 [Enterococcus sp. 7E2_DIV0204]|nr:hypothetical protein A5819_000279 [Enterococcus sp. 7E2_DIV0204]OTP49487.1 hypothetical protein A5884_002685 [Enterococcus sp. 7D2_DIV0200]
MMIEDKKRKLRWQADETEDRVRDLKKKMKRHSLYRILHVYINDKEKS